MLMKHPLRLQQVSGDGLSCSNFVWLSTYELNEKSVIFCPIHMGLGMQTWVGAWFWCVLVEILGPLPRALINGDGLSAASMSYWLIHGLADLSPLWFSSCMMPASHHSDISCAPVYFRVVFHEPSMP